MPTTSRPTRPVLIAKVAEIKTRQQKSKEQEKTIDDLEKQRPVSAGEKEVEREGLATCLQKYKKTIFICVILVFACVLVVFIKLELIWYESSREAKES